VSSVATEPIDVVTEALARAGCELRGNSARCPAHDDRNPSLSVNVGDDGRVLLNCHGPCTAQDVVDALGIPMSALFPTKETIRDNGTLATYEYETTPPMRVVRTLGKRFYQQHQGPDGRWVKGAVPAEDRVLYRRSELLTRAAAGGDVFVVEGEKDVESLRTKGECATTNIMGAGKWLAHYARDFDGIAQVVVVADKDKDKTGMKHARQVATALRPVVPEVVICEALVGKDVTDHLLAGHGVDELVVILDEDDENDPEDDDDGMVPLIDWTHVHDPDDDVVEGLVIYGRWLQLVAQAKEGKSSFEAWVALELSEGRDPFDGTQRDPVRVLYCLGEMWKPDLEELIRDCGHDPVRLANFHATEQRMRLDTEIGAGRLLRRVDQLGSQVVILDGLNGFINPEASENDDKTWRPFVDYTADPLRQRGIALVSADNMGKDPARGSRGSSVKNDKADGVVAVKRTDSGVQLHLTHGRGGAYLTTDLYLDAEGFDRSRPIRYWRAAGGWPDGTKDAVEVLDQLGVPLDEGRRKVQTRLRDEIARAETVGLDPEPFRIRTLVLAAALRFRKANPIGRP
jgi:AAA domain